MHEASSVQALLRGSRSPDGRCAQIDIIRDRQIRAFGRMTRRNHILLSKKAAPNVPEV